MEGYEVNLNLAATGRITILSKCLRKNLLCAFVAQMVGDGCLLCIHSNDSVMHICELVYMFSSFFILLSVKWMRHKAYLEECFRQRSLYDNSSFHAIVISHNHKVCVKEFLECAFMGCITY